MRGNFLSYALSFVAAAVAIVPTGVSFANESVGRVLLYDYSVTGGNVQARTYLRDALTRLAAAKGFELVMIREKDSFPRFGLDSYNVVILSNGEGDVLPDQKAHAALAHYLNEGGGLIAVHAAGGLATSFPLLSEIVGVKYRPTGIARFFEARVGMDGGVIGKEEERRIFRGLPDEVVLRDRWLVFDGNPREREGNTVLLNLQDPGGRGVPAGKRPVVWAKSMGKGRAVYNGLGAEDVYTQADGYGEKLLWTLMEYVAAKSPRPKVQAMNGVPNFDLAWTGKALALSLPEGSYDVSIADSRGRVVQSGSFHGPGSFRLALKQRGMLMVHVKGPAGQIQKRLLID